jgi:hypothetical protein
MAWNSIARFPASDTGALAFRDLIQIGASHYEVSNAAALAQVTHKFQHG